jgi:hypothetical protein
MRLFLLLAVSFGLGFATSQFMLQREEARLKSRTQFLEEMSKKNHEELQKDIEICRKIYLARDKINRSTKHSVFQRTTQILLKWELQSTKSEMLEISVI